MDNSEVISFKRKVTLLAWFMLGYMVFYIFPNFYASWRPVQLPLTVVDRRVPLVPWSFLIYTSDYLLISLTILMINSKVSFFSFSRMMFSALVLCGLCFLFFPTTYPRPIYPTVEQTWIQLVMDFVDVADSPNNCFPSMHVALTSIAAWNLRNKPTPIFVLFLIWTLAVIVSTLTTKQHYFVDIIGGLTVVVMTAVLEKKLFSRWFSGEGSTRRTVETTGLTKLF
jgi:membrane-associated phospholipid phosphatase